MRRWLLSLCLYLLLGLCRCYFLEQYPSEETGFLLVWLDQQILFVEVICGTEKPIERIYCVGCIYSIYCTSGISMMKGRFWNSGGSSLASVTNTLTVSTTWKQQEKNIYVWLMQWIDDNKVKCTYHIESKNILYCARPLCSRALRSRLVSTKKRCQSVTLSHGGGQIYSTFLQNKSLINRPTSLSSSLIRVTFPVLESTLKYSLEPFSKVRPYRTGSPSGSVPFRMYICVPMWQKMSKKQ